MPSIDVLDSTMHYERTGDSVVYLHGNPTSSHAWRNVLPVVPGIAPDLIGMGRSGKPDIAYSFADHARYLDAFLDALGLDEVVVVGHDWGGALAFDWAARHPERVRGLAFFETIVKPFAWEEYPARERVEAFRTPGVGERLVLEENVFIEQAFDATVLGDLSAEDRAVYAAPYPTPASRAPLLAWPRSTPIEGEPADVVARVEAYDAWLAASPVPKLLLTFEGSPTLIMRAPLVEWCKANIANLEVVACGDAGHLALEDQPDAIASALASWLARTAPLTSAA
jgi:haloalkane dehalogenase